MSRDYKERVPDAEALAVEPGLVGVVGVHAELSGVGQIGIIRLGKYNWFRAPHLPTIHFLTASPSPTLPLPTPRHLSACPSPTHLTLFLLPDYYSIHLILI